MKRGMVPTQEEQGFCLLMTMTIYIGGVLQFADIILSILLLDPQNSLVGWAAAHVCLSLFYRNWSLERRDLLEQ